MFNSSEGVCTHEKVHVVLATGSDDTPWLNELDGFFDETQFGIVQRSEVLVVEDPSLYINQYLFHGREVSTYPAP